MNFVKNPYNVSRKYTPKGFTLPKLPFPSVLCMAFHETENAQLCSARIKTSAVVRTRGHTSDSTTGQKGSYPKLPRA